MSRDCACSIVVGQGAPWAPLRVKVLRVTSHSAVVCWFPSNTNYPHNVLVNSVKVCTSPVGVFQQDISGLNPSTTYRVSVSLENPHRAPGIGTGNPAPEESEALATHVVFHTLSKGHFYSIFQSITKNSICVLCIHVKTYLLALKLYVVLLYFFLKIDLVAPSNVRVESGPQDSKMLVTWSPVTDEMIVRDPLNRKFVTGYSIFADGKYISLIN